MVNFWSKVGNRGEEGCWEWQGAKTGNGYGGFKLKGKMQGAHRVSWELSNGAIPEGLCVLHRCDNPVCVNPSHLFLGTLADNAQDRSAKGRGGTPAGENHWSCKLTREQVATIRQTAESGMSGHSLAKLYGISPSQACKIIRREDWRGEDAAMNVIDQEFGQEWALYNGDSAEVLKALPSHGMDLAIYSPPFANLYCYSPFERDLGNTRDSDEFFHHLGYVSRELLRVMRPGRNICVHVQQLTTQKARDGVIALRDFRGEMIRHYQESGFVYHGEICIDKCPQAQAIRTKSKSLLFVQLRKDSSWLRPALADYILLFRAPGDNAVPIKPDLTNNEWIEWARPIWYNIRETYTLNVATARENADERHICPLQLDTIERCVRLWSNPGEVVLSPFAGLGSEGYVSLLQHRRFVGVELKPSYYRSGVKNLMEAERLATAPNLFSELEEPNGVAVSGEETKCAR